MWLTMTLRILSLVTMVPLLYLLFCSIRANEYIHAGIAIGLLGFVIYMSLTFT